MATTMRVLSVLGGLLLAMTLLASCGDVTPTPSQPVTATIPVTATPGTPPTLVMATASGTLRYVDIERRIVIVTTQSATDIVLSVAMTASVTADGAVTVLANLADRIDSKVNATYNKANNIAISVEVFD
ncbi:MAG: hypothetical protein O6920_03330 [Chloroflexi bacterium]|nr:hypothetical protein [Chloroflexota bacterium]